MKQIEELEDIRVLNEEKAERVKERIKNIFG